MKRVRYSVGLEFDPHLKINKTMRAFAKTKTGFSWDVLRPNHRYSTDYWKSPGGSIWIRQA